MLRSALRLSSASSLLVQRRVSTAISSPRLPTSPFHHTPSARKLSTTTPRYAALTGDTPTQSIAVLQTPSPEYLEKEELDVGVLSPDQIDLIITDRAAKQLKLITTGDGDPSAALRISVESGGCHGYQYKMQLDREILPDDYCFSHPVVKPSNVIVDAVSLPFINGSKVDYVTELIGSSFRVMNNPQAKTSGCGCGLSWELKGSE